MKSTIRYSGPIAGAALCACALLLAAGGAGGQAQPNARAAQRVPDTAPAVVVEPADPNAPRVAVVPPPVPEAPPAVAVIPSDPNLPAAVIVPPTNGKVEIAIAAVGPAPASYPPCSATVTDRCIQVPRSRRRGR
jgi:hypothetical protein